LARTQLAQVASIQLALTVKTAECEIESIPMALIALLDAGIRRRIQF